jgi:hypothetical protein
VQLTSLYGVNCTIDDPQSAECAVVVPHPGEAPGFGPASFPVLAAV